MKDILENNNNIETSTDAVNSERPANFQKNNTNRVDINILKSKLEEEQSREFKKNLIIISFCIFLLAAIGIYLSL